MMKVCIQTREGGAAINQEMKGRGNETTKAQQQRGDEDGYNRYAATLKLKKPQKTPMLTLQ